MSARRSSDQGSRARAAANLFPELETSTTAVLAETDEISAGRKAALERLATLIEERAGAGGTAKLVFICTHNSRRSQMAQVWARTAAYRFAVPRVEAFSGGTEATAFDPRAVAALDRAGFRIDARDRGDNPRYAVRYSHDAQPLVCFSKVYDQPPNPTDGFCAVMTCSQADADCPLGAGASERIAIPYDDPKAFDGTAQEATRYDERCRQIAREMLYLFSRVSNRPRRQRG